MENNNNIENKLFELRDLLIEICDKLESKKSVKDLKVNLNVYKDDGDIFYRLKLKQS